MAKLKGHKAALVIGLFFAAIHAIWALIIAIIPAIFQRWLNWIFKVHFLMPYWNITGFNFVDALLLVVVTFVIGYAGTWLFVWLWNLVKVKK